jgi:DNA polymerase I-like protein with 3'-5' exonuclease and polymerase domains
LARDTYLKSILDDDDRNIFVEVGRQFYGPEFTKADKEGYIRTKAIVHGLNYGREAYSIAMEHKMSLDKAQQYIDQFFELIPEVVAWRDSVKGQVHGGQDLISPFGNHRRFWLITKESKDSVEKEALAFYPQNIVSNLLLRAGIRLANEGMQDMLRIPIHDSWLFECEEDIKDDVGEHVSRVMEETAIEYFSDYVKFPVDLKFGKSWGDIA